MALKDKLVTLEDLKVVHDEAIDLQSAMSHLPDGVGGITGARPFVFEERYYYYTAESGSAATKTPSESYACAKLDVEPGEVITITGYAGNGRQRLYVWMDASGNSLGYYTGPTGLKENMTVTVPNDIEGIKSVGINTKFTEMPDGFYAYVGDNSSRAAISELKNRMDDAEASLAVSAYNTANLPDGYKPKMCIESDGNTIIDTGIGWLDHPTIEIDVLSTGGYFFGNQRATTRRFTGGMDMGWRYGSIVVQGEDTNDYINKHCSVRFSDSCLAINGETIQSFDSSGVTGSEYTIGLFAERYSGSGSSSHLFANSGTRIFRVKIQNSTGLVFDGIPCVQTSTGYVGFYDIVNGAFHGPEEGNPSAIAFKSLVEIVTEVDSGSGTKDVTLDDITRYGTDGVYTSSFSIVLPFSGSYKNKIFTCRAKYTQSSGVTDVPLITFKTGTGTNKTCPYTIGENGRFAIKEWRTVRCPGDKTNLNIDITIPTGVTLYITEFYSRETDVIDRSAISFVRLNGHQRMPMTPNDTLPAVLMAAKAGYSTFIEIPKRLSDPEGKWIFYHGDAGTETIKLSSTYIRQADGSALPSQYDGVNFRDLDYATVMSWDWGISKGAHFAGLKPMTMEEFFEVCAKTGIMPMFSMHPMGHWVYTSGGVNINYLPEIKEKAQKYGVLSKLGLKSSDAWFATLYATFENDVESYTIDVLSASPNTGETVTEAIAREVGLAISKFNSKPDCTVRRVVELGQNLAYNSYFPSGDNAGDPYDVFEVITAAGYECAIAFVSSNGKSPTLPGKTTNGLFAQDFSWWAKEHGVHEYTDEYNWSTGLNW